MPRTFRLQKLVRDNIVAFNEERGAAVAYKTLKGYELQQALVAKISEEAKELQDAKVSKEELADLQEIIDQLCINAGIPKKDLQTIQARKNSKNGAFAKGHFIETLTLPEGNEWINYYAADPKRFPEIS